jgi:hypothetical protein
LKNQLSTLIGLWDGVRPTKVADLTALLQKREEQL